MNDFFDYWRKCILFARATSSNTVDALQHVEGCPAKRDPVRLVDECTCPDAAEITISPAWLGNGYGK